MAVVCDRHAGQVVSSNPAWMASSAFRYFNGEDAEDTTTAIEGSVRT